MKNNFKQKQGITLIALVITIIVLLILAGVSIAMLTGQNGILSQAENAKVQQSHSSVVEAIKLEYNNWQIEINTADVTKVASTETVKIQGENKKLEANETVSTTFLAYLEGKGYVDKDTNKVLVEALLGTKPALGNGETTDIYVIEENTENQTYNLYYLAEDGTTRTDLWNIGITVAGNDDPFSYTKADEEKSMEYFTWREVIVDEGMKERRGYDDTIQVGDTVVVIDGIVEEYYKNNIADDIPLTKVVIPNKIDNKYVDIDFKYMMLYCLDNVQTFIYNNDYGVFFKTNGVDSKCENIKIPNKTPDCGLYEMPNLINIKADEENEFYIVEDGVLYGILPDKTKVAIIKYPPQKEGESYVISDKIMYIGGYAFSYCKNLHTVKLPSNQYFTEILAGCFEKCINLEELYIPNTVTKIEYDAFENCDNLTITVEADSPLTWEDFEDTGISEDRVIFE